MTCPAFLYARIRIVECTSKARRPRQEKDSRCVSRTRESFTVHSVDVVGAGGILSL
jgi:hypothetical protein